MSRWLFLFATCLLIIAISSSPITKGNKLKAVNPQGRQSNEGSSGTSGGVSSVSSGSSDTEDDEEEDDDDDDLGLTEDDDEDDEEEGGGGGGGGASSDDDEEEDDDYDFERILDDILGDEDDEEDEEEGETSPESSSVAPSTTTSTTTLTPIQGLAAFPEEEIEQPVAVSDHSSFTGTEEDQEQTGGDTNSNTITLLTNSQPEEVDEAQEQILNTNDIGTVGNDPGGVAAAAISSSTTTTTSEPDEEEDEEEDEVDVLADDDDDDDEEEEEGRSAKGVEAAVPVGYITKYNKYIDSVYSRINKILQKNYDPVNVRLQTATSTKKKTTNSKTQSKNKKRPAATRPSSRNDEAASEMNIINGTTVTTGVSRAQTRVMRKRKPSHKTASKGSSKKSPPVRARATLYGLSSLRREGDVIVNVQNTHTLVRSKFLVGPLTLKVEKEFGRGAKKDIRSAIATTSEMFGKLNLKVVHGGNTSLSSIKVMQPKQMRVESAEENDQTSEFVWKRSSDFAKVVSQKLSNVARSLLPQQPKSENPSTK